jgi:hypothetical protein
MHDMNCATGDLFVATLSIADCWNGTQLDSPDHSSHLVGAVWDNDNHLNKCPVTHPYRIPDMSIISYFKTDATFPNWQWTSDRQMGLPLADAGMTGHGDYMEGWSPTAKARWTKGCIDGHRSCNNGEMGDGWVIKEAGNQGSGLTIKVPDTGVN